MLLFERLPEVLPKQIQHISKKTYCIKLYYRLLNIDLVCIGHLYIHENEESASGPFWLVRILLPLYFLRRFPTTYNRSSSLLHRQPKYKHTQNSHTQIYTKTQKRKTHTNTDLLSGFFASLFDLPPFILILQKK